MNEIVQRAAHAACTMLNWRAGDKQKSGWQ